MGTYTHAQIRMQSTPISFTCKNSSTSLIPEKKRVVLLILTERKCEEKTYGKRNNEKEREDSE